MDNPYLFLGLLGLHGNTSNRTLRPFESTTMAVGQKKGTPKKHQTYLRGMELQRHCAEDWNQFAGILIQCLLGSPGKPRFSPDFWFGRERFVGVIFGHWPFLDCLFLGVLLVGLIVCCELFVIFFGGLILVYRVGCCSLGG